MEEFWDTFVIALLIGVIIGVYSISFINRVNISDEELYRFCIVRKIELEDCVIPLFPLKTVEQK